MNRPLRLVTARATCKPASAQLLTIPAATRGKDWTLVLTSQLHWRILRTVFTVIWLQGLAGPQCTPYLCSFMYFVLRSNLDAYG